MKKKMEEPDPIILVPKCKLIDFERANITCSSIAKLTIF